MRRRSWWWFSLAFALFAVCATWFVWSRGVALRQSLAASLTAQARRVLPGAPSIGHVSALPWQIALQNVRWPANTLSTQSIVQAYQIIVRPSLRDLLLGRLSFSRVTVQAVSLTVTRSPDGRWNVATAAHESPATALHVAALRHFLAEGKLPLQRIEVVQGAIHFEDRAESQPITLDMHEVHLVLRPMPKLGHLWAVGFAAEGKLRVRPDGRDSPVRVEGWVDPLTKDLQARFRLTDVELGPLEPYYQGRVTKVRAYGGRLSLNGTARSVANALTMRCTARLSNLTKGDISILGRTIADVGGALNGSQGALTMTFAVRGPLDQPRQWKYQLGPHQAPIILLFLPFMKPMGETTVITIGPAQVDVGSAVRQWLGPPTSMPQSQDVPPPAAVPTQ